MINGIYKVLGSGDLKEAPSQNQQGGILYKRQIRLQEFAGFNRLDSPERISNAVIATMLGSLAESYLPEGAVVVASLRTSIHEYQGQWYQDITVADIVKLF